MANILNKIGIKTKKKEKEPSFDKSHDIKPLSVFITIVNRGQAESILSLFKKFLVSVQFVQKGTGTATKKVNDILGIDDPRKDIIISFVRSEECLDIKKELDSYFLMNKRNRGISFSIPMTSLAGITAYKFISNT